MRKKAFILVTTMILIGIVLTGCRVRSASQGDGKEPTLAGDRLASNDNPTETTVAFITPTDEFLAPTLTPTIFTLPTESPTLFVTNTLAVVFPSETPLGVGVLPSETPFVFPSETPFVFPSDTPTQFPTDTPTHTPLPTETPSMTPTPTATQTPTPLATSTFTPFPSITPVGGNIVDGQQPVVVDGQPTVIAQVETIFPQQQTATAIILTFDASQGTFYPTSTFTGLDAGSGQQPVLATNTPPGTFPDCDYLIQPGDTLSTIARTYNLTTDELVIRNSYTNQNFIKAGDTMIIPGCGRNPTPVPTGSAADNPSLTPVYDNQLGPIQYTVVTGDNIYRLSVQFGVTMRDILIANPRITDINAIFAGETLTIPTRTNFGTPAPTTEGVPQAFPTATFANAPAG